MRTLDKLKDILCAELDEIAMKGEMNAGDLETVHKLTDTIKNIDKIECIEEDGYSMDGGWVARGNYSRDMMYDTGNSYARRRYSRGRGYSMDDGKMDIIRRIDEMIDDPELTREDKMALKRAKEQLR